jgi:hypothetical protein
MRFAGETAEHRGRRGELPGVEGRDVEHRVHNAADPLAAGVEDQDARVRARLRLRQLEAIPQVDQRNDASLIVDHPVDPRRNVRHRRRRLEAKHALDRVDVGREQVVAEPEGDDLRDRPRVVGGPAVISMALPVTQAATSASASTIATSSLP